MSWIFKTSVFWDVTQCSLVHLPNHTVTSQETPVFIVNGLRTPNLTTWMIFILQTEFPETIHTIRNQ